MSTEASFQRAEAHSLLMRLLVLLLLYGGLMVHHRDYAEVLGMEEKVCVVCEQLE
jgi:hypothetical protein